MRKNVISANYFYGMEIDLIYIVINFVEKSDILSVCLMYIWI